MMKMYLNGVLTEPIDISSFTRNLDVPNTDIRFHIGLSFDGDYSADGIEYLANYADKAITSIKIISEDNSTTYLNVTQTNARLESLGETCTESGRNGYANIVTYEVV